jgi:hypothetical protein
MIKRWQEDKHNTIRQTIQWTVVFVFLSSFGYCIFCLIVLCLSSCHHLVIVLSVLLCCVCRFVIFWLLYCLSYCVVFVFLSFFGHCIVCLIVLCLSSCHLLVIVLSVLLCCVCLLVIFWSLYCLSYCVVISLKVYILIPRSCRNIFVSAETIISDAFSYSECIKINKSRKMSRMFFLSMCYVKICLITKLRTILQRESQNS